MTVDEGEWIPLAKALTTIQDLDPIWDAKAMLSDALCSGLLRSRSWGSAKGYNPKKETLGPSGEIIPAVWECVFEKDGSWNACELNWRASSCKLNDRFYGQLSFIKVCVRDLEGLVGRSIMADPARYFSDEHKTSSIAEMNDQTGENGQSQSATPKLTGPGRPPANWWPDFAEELAVQLHEYGPPEKQAELISAVQEALVARGKAEPSRSQIQPVVRAVLARIGAAGN